jgi:hypothetical protein
MAREMDPATRAKVIDLYRAGKRVRDITDETGVAKSSLYYVLRQAGITPNQRPSRAAPLIDRDLLGQVSDPDTGSRLVDDLLRRIAELEREVGRLQAIIMGYRSDGPPERR